ncbi:MAG: hypothetical protein RIE59_14205, partial [Imperialibacter sp.]
VLFNGQPEYLVSLFKNSTYYPAMRQLSSPETTQNTTERITKTTADSKAQIFTQTTDNQSV